MKKASVWTLIAVFLLVTKSASINAAEDSVTTTEAIQPVSVSDEQRALLELLAGNSLASSETPAEQEAEVVEKKRPVVRATEASFAKRLKQTTPRSSFDALLEALERENDPARALARLERYVTDHAEHRDARLMLARRLLLEAQPDAALRHLDVLTTPAMRRGHPDWQAWFWAGSAYLMKLDLLAARDHLEVAIDKDGAAPEVWVQLAIVEQELGETPAALQYLEIAEQIDPQLPEVHLNRAYALERSSDLAGAARAYQRYLASRSDRATGVKLDVLKQLNTIAAVSP